MDECATSDLAHSSYVCVYIEQQSLNEGQDKKRETAKAMEMDATAIIAFMKHKDPRGQESREETDLCGSVVVTATAFHERAHRTYARS